MNKRYGNKPEFAGPRKAPPPYGIITYGNNESVSQLLRYADNRTPTKRSSYFCTIFIDKKYAIEKSGTLHHIQNDFTVPAGTPDQK
jgi:hypothetical protein